MVGQTKDDGDVLGKPVSRMRPAWLYPPNRGDRVTPADATTHLRPGRRPATSDLRRLPLAVVPEIPNAEPADGERRSGWSHLWHSTKRHASAFRRYFSIRTNDLAAIIAFNGLIAVVPLFLLVVAIAGLLLRDEGLYLEFRKTVISIFPSQGARDALDDASASRDNVGWFSLLSFIGFVWIGTSFVATVTRAINSLYEVRGSPFIRSRIRAFVVIVGFSLLLMIAVLAGTLPTLFVWREVQPYFRDVWGVEDLFLFQAVGQLISYAVSLVSAFLLFLTAYRYLPAVKQSFRDVIPGSLVASAGLVILAQVFPIYVRIYQSLPSSSSYGAAFVFVSILVTWAYVLSHVLLIGAWLNARAEERRRIHRALTMTHVDVTGRGSDRSVQRTPLNEPPPLPPAE